MKQCKLATGESLEQALNEAEEKAHKNLARYKFMNFGYWAAIWQHLNRIGNFNRPNPFAIYVDLARKQGKNMKGGEFEAKEERKSDQ
jgi:hypothetical protein